MQLALVGLLVILSQTIGSDDFDEVDTIPSHFDAREMWDNCNIGHVMNQGACQSSWAVAAVSVLADRLCIETDGVVNVTLSVQDMLGCCNDDTCSDGCNGATSIAAWSHLVNEGVVTGGDYKSHQGCKPYMYKPCSSSSCDTTYVKSPKCSQSCQKSYTAHTYDNDLYKAEMYYIFTNGSVKDIQREILNNGPVQAVLNYFDDLPSYKTGVYTHSNTADLAGQQYVKMIGWGESNGTDYWIAVNSWGTKWGQKGILWIQRGTNESDVESTILAGVPYI